MSSEESIDKAFELLNDATDLEEKEGSSEGRMAAATKYFEACYLMKRYVNRMPAGTSSKSSALIKEKIDHYEKHASSLLQGCGNGETQNHEQSFIPTAIAVPVATFNHPAGAEISGGRRPRSQTAIMREGIATEKAGQANARLAKALDLDERGQKQDALAEYMAAAELYLGAVKIVDEIETEGSGGVHPISALLKRRLEGAMDRIEHLKNPSKAEKSRVARVQTQNEPSVALTSSEIEVLKRSSLISSGVFMPWSDDEAENFDYGLNSGKPWTDPDGLLKLSDKQTEKFHKWARPAEILSLRGRIFSSTAAQRIVMVKSITPYSIRQKCVTDCSFIASLCICAAFERRFNRSLITSIIYPQNKDGYPIYNKSGKYMVKLWLNGVARRVVIDDLLPVDKNGNFLCSHTDSTWSGLELWVSIIEKAYMKLCGGYDFPGSNSGVDLFSLTGWIPERIFFPENPSKVRDFETPTERAWERVHSANSYGDCLITASTSSDISEKMADQVGLVTGHAYAVLSVIKTTNGTRLLQLKNPWAHRGWKGKFSCHDEESWRDPQFCDEVGYNPKVASRYDDGVFWISWEDILVYFRNLHLSWNPALFAFRATTHGFWPKEQGPVDDSFNVGDNPQYILTLSDKAVKSKATVWILSSRHVSKQEQEGSEVTDFLTLHIHRNDVKKERIFYPGGKKCVFTGAYTNNPHVLVRYDVSGPEDKYLSLVLSQHQKSNDLGYTLSCFCTSSFKLGKPTKEQQHSTVINSRWTEDSAGGRVGDESFGSNPMWSVEVPGEGASVQITCSAVKTFAINVMLIKVDVDGTRVQKVRKGAPIIDSGNYRHGFVATGVCWVPGGSYTLVISTFTPGQVGAFSMKLYSSAKLQPVSIP